MQHKKIALNIFFCVDPFAMLPYIQVINNAEHAAPTEGTDR